MDDSRAAAEKGTQYGVAEVETATGARPTARVMEAAPAERAKKVAVFVVHGVGQQIPFQTLDQVAEGLRRQDNYSGEKPEVRAVKFDDRWVHRIELKLRNDSPTPVEAHVYEGYWAPLTEGKISAGGVISFLRSAGRNGIQNGSRTFYRWLFGSYTPFPSPIRIVLYLLIALATVISLVAMNSTIALVAAGRALLADKPEWLTAELFRDLTTTFNVVVTAMVLFGLSLAVAKLLRSQRLRVPASARLAWGWFTVLLFVVALFLVVLAGLALPLLFYGHVKGEIPDTGQLWHRVFPRQVVDGFNTGFETWAWWLTLAAGALFLGWWLFRIGWGVVRDLGRSRGRWLTILVTICLAMLGGLAVWLALALWDALHTLGGEKVATVVQGGVAWPLLVGASAYIRRVLVQYVGDVAIYAAPYKLDSFFQLRDQIKECVQKVAYAVYAQQRDDGSGPEYDEVFVVGHSLGSVIVYDVLNRLVNEDEAAGGTLQVVARTPLLLTFGSPLDKTAFLFAVQRNQTNEAREALAAAVQPLIRDYRFRPERWINIYSPWDIISGDLGFYDPLKSAHPTKAVQNEPDPDATTLLAAHLEYWSNPLLFRTLYAAL